VAATALQRWQQTASHRSKTEDRAAELVVVALMVTVDLLVALVAATGSCGY